jgi:hypothetical protein
LRAGIAAARNDKRQEQREHKRLRQFFLIIGHCRRGQRFSQEQNHEPAGAFAHHSPEWNAHIRLFQSLHPAELLDVLGRLLLGHVKHVIDRHDADQDVV